MLKVAMVGATGWTGRAITAGILDAEDMTLVGAVARKAAGQDIGTVLGRDPVGLVVSGSLSEVLDAAGPDVVIDYTHPSAIAEHIRQAIVAKAGVVVGTSGLNAADYETIDAEARRHGVGVVASGNFSLTAALINHFALTAARFIEHFEIVDYAKSAKPDAPSGTALELAERMGEVRRPRLDWPLEDLIGDRALRGGSVNNVQVHSIRLPSYAASVDVHFAIPGARMMLRHDAAPQPEPYVWGSLFAARRVPGIVGLVRGLDRLLLDEEGGRER